jgi:hypothetical protein
VQSNELAEQAKSDTTKICRRKCGGDMQRKLRFSPEERLARAIPRVSAAKIDKNVSINILGRAGWTRLSA